jgi:hypothetical protein
MAGGGNCWMGSSLVLGFSSIGVVHRHAMGWRLHFPNPLEGSHIYQSSSSSLSFRSNRLVNVCKNYWQCARPWWSNEIKNGLMEAHENALLKNKCWKPFLSSFSRESLPEPNAFTSGIEHWTTRYLHRWSWSDNVLERTSGRPGNSSYFSFFEAHCNKYRVVEQNCLRLCLTLLRSSNILCC